MAARLRQLSCPILAQQFHGRRIQPTTIQQNRRQLHNFPLLVFIPAFLHPTHGISSRYTSFHTAFIPIHTRVSRLIIPCRPLQQLAAHTDSPPSSAQSKSIFFVHQQPSSEKQHKRSPTAYSLGRWPLAHTRQHPTCDKGTCELSGPSTWRACSGGRQYPTFARQPHKKGGRTPKGQRALFAIFAEQNDVFAIYGCLQQSPLASRLVCLSIARFVPALQKV